MKRILAFQLWFAALFAAIIVYSETGTRRFCQPARFPGMSSAARAYESRDHTGEVVFLGSSQMGIAIIPLAVEEGLAARGIDHEVYELWFPEAMAPTYYTVFRDLVVPNGRPRLVVIGLAPRDFNANGPLYASVEALASLPDAARLISRRPWQRRSLIWRVINRSAAVPPQLPLMARYGQLVEDKLRRRGTHWRYDPEQGENTPQEAPRFAAFDEENYQGELERMRGRLADFSFGALPEWLFDTLRLLTVTNYRPLIVFSKLLFK